MINYEKLGNLCSFENGDRGKNYPKDNDFVPNGIPFVSGIAINNGQLLTDEIRFITEKKYNQLRAGKAKKGDILYSLRGSLGKCAISQFDKLVIASALVIIRPNLKINRDYLYYILLSDYFNKQVENYDNGSIQANISVEVLKDLLIPLPSISKQEKIVNILKTIDKKIQNNNQIISKLKLMSKTLYDYWFLQFDFPNIEGKPYKSSGGEMIYNKQINKEIPKGWTVKQIKDVCKCCLGGTPSTKIEEYWNGDIPWINSGEVSSFPVIKSAETISHLGLKESNTEYMKEGTVVVSITGNIRVSFLGFDACANQSVVGIYENTNIKKEYLYPTISNMIKRYISISGGNCQKHISKAEIENTFISIPNESVLNDYYEKTESLYSRIITCAKENLELSSLSCFLMPLLINGQVEIR